MEFELLSIEVTTIVSRGKMWGGTKSTNAGIRREGNGSEERRFIMPAWWILFIANGWFGGDSLYYVPSHGVALLHQAVSIAQRVAC